MAAQSRESENLLLPLVSSISLQKPGRRQCQLLVNKQIIFLESSRLSNTPNCQQVFHLCHAGKLPVMGKVGWDHWSPPSPTSLLQQASLEHFTQDCVQMAFEDVQRKRILSFGKIRSSEKRWGLKEPWNSYLACFFDTSTPYGTTPTPIFPDQQLLNLFSEALPMTEFAGLQWVTFPLGFLKPNPGFVAVSAHRIYCPPTPPKCGGKVTSVIAVAFFLFDNDYSGGSRILQTKH